MKKKAVLLLTCKSVPNGKNAPVANTIKPGKCQCRPASDSESERWHSLSELDLSLVGTVFKIAYKFDCLLISYNNNKNRGPEIMHKTR